MKSHINIINYLILSMTIDAITALTNLLNSSIHTCISCVCHTTTGCYSLQNCARYSINYKYWENAGAPTLTIDSDVNWKTYQECMADDNCIINTIHKHIDTFWKPDCNCDGLHDCRDKLSIHLLREDCKPVTSTAYRSRYNRCAINRGLSQLDPTLKCPDEDT